MIKKPSITELEIRIIRFFLEHIGEEFALRELSREAKTDYKLIYLTVQKLVKKGVLLKKRQANVDICSLNLQGRSDMINYIEGVRTIDFFQKHKELQNFFENVLLKTRSIFHNLIIFGSFAKGIEHKGSDIDLLIITSTRESGEEIERIVNSEAVFLKRAVHSIVLDEKEFLTNLTSKDLNVVKEAFKNHIIISGIETFYRGVKLTR